MKETNNSSRTRFFANLW